MARRGNAIYLEGGVKASPFADMAEKIDRLGGDLKKIIDEALNEAGEKITADTHAAMAKGGLPAQGKYSTGKTEGTIINGRVSWSGSVAELPVGFDKSKPGAGGFLITGTPRMRPVAALEKIYVQKRYVGNIQRMITKRLESELKRLGG